MIAAAFASGALAWWSSLYADHQAVSVTVRFLHLAGLLVGGGTAVAADRHLIAAAWHPTAREAALSLAGASHQIVVPALAVMALTGALMAAADLDTFLQSRLFWIKLASVASLLTNGALLVAAERGTRRRNGEADWVRLRARSVVSLALWLATLLAGTWLTVAA